MMEPSWAQLSHASSKKIAYLLIQIKYLSRQPPFSNFKYLAIFKSQHLIQLGIFGSEKNLLMDGMICGDLLHTNFLTAYYEHFLPSSKLSSTPAVLCSLVNLIAYSNLEMLNYCGDFFPFSFLWKFFLCCPTYLPRWIPADAVLYRQRTIRHLTRVL